MDFGFGIGGLIVLILDIWALVRVASSGASVGAKLIWAIVILVFPIIGFIAWLIAGPK